MDNIAEKDKTLVEKSPSFDSSSRSTIDDEDHKDKSLLDKTESGKDNNTNNEDLPHDHDDDHGVKSPSSPTSRSHADPEPEPEPEKIDAEIKEDEGEQAEIKQDQETEESSPLPPDLNKVSELVDQYISSLSSESQEHESVLPDLPIAIEQFLILLEAKTDDYDSADHSPVIWRRLSKEDSDSYLEAVNRVSSLSKALSRYSSVYKYACSVNRIGSVLQHAVSYVEEEFKSLLQDYKIHDSDPGYQESDHSRVHETDHNPEEILSDLIRLSGAMIAGGYETECRQAYLVARKTALEGRLHQLGFQKYSIDEVHKMQWESLAREVEAWIKLFKQCATVCFPEERKLCDAIFSNHESLFGSLSHGVTIQLLSFAEAVALTKRAPEKLFKFVDVYEALRDVLPAIDNLFPEEWLNELKTEASVIRSRLGEAVILVFNELENSIKADSAKAPVPGGAVHPLVKYTMNYMEYVSAYRKTLEQIFWEHQKIEPAARSELDGNSQNQDNSSSSVHQSPLQAQITKIMDLLDSTVEARSKLYKDPSLSNIFMMNNGRYILKKIRGCPELNGLMGDAWYRKKSSDMRQYHKGYQRETWGKLLSCLHPEGLTANGKVVKPVLKERFKSFNAMFDEIHKTQSNWVVADEQLQSELRVSVSNMVIPAYRSFLGRYSQVLTPGRQTEKYVKYQGEDIEKYIDDLFDGTATQVGRKKQ